MFAFNWSTFCLVFAAIFALSQQKPLANENVDGKKVAENSHSNDGKINATDSSPTMMAMDKSRASYFPNSAGYAYYNLGQVQMPTPHYPTGWAYQPYQAAPSMMNSMQYKNEENVDASDARTFTHLRPTPYSQQYQQLASSQAYAYPAQSYHAQSYPYAASFPSSGLDHYSGLGHYSNYASYSPVYRDAEEEKPRQFANFMASDRYASAVQPFNRYTTKYWYESPVASSSAMQAQSGSQMSQATPAYIRDSMPEAEWHPDAFQNKYPSMESNMLPASEFLERAVTVDDQLQMHIPNDYMVEKLHHHLPASQVMPLSYATSNQRMIGRAAAEEQAKPYKPLQWFQPLQPWYTYDTQPMNLKNMDVGQSIQDPVITPQDAVYMEANNLAEPSHVQSSRSAEPQMMLATYPNREQQMRIAQMQLYNNMMTNAASQIEPLAHDYAKQRDMMWLHNAPVAIGRSSDVDSQTLDKIIKELEDVRKDLRALDKADTFAEGIKDSVKQEKTDKTAHSDKPTVPSSGASEGSKKSS